MTPELGRGCLGGIVRGRLLAALAGEQAGPGGGVAELPEILRGLAVREGRIEPGELARASEIMLTNTTGGVIPVREIQHLWTADSLGLPRAGGVTAALASLLESLEGAAEGGLRA